MRRDDHELEKYLIEFQPRRVRRLELQRPIARVRMGRLAAAALVLLSVSVGLWYAQRGRNTTMVRTTVPRVRIEFHLAERELNSITWTKLALDDPEKFEAQLDAESRRTLPDLQGPQSTLGALAKE